MGTLGTVISELARSQKSAVGVSLYSRWVNRPLGRPLAAVAVRLGVSADGVTAASAAVSGLALVALCTWPPSFALGVVVALLLVLGFALDSADGQVARYTGTGSAAGEWLDHVVDAGKHVAVHGAVLIAWFRFELVPSDRWLLVPLAYQMVAVVVFAAGTLEPLLRRASGTPAPRTPSTVRALALLPADFGILAGAFLLWGAPAAFRVVYTALLVLTTLVGAALLVRWSRALRARQGSPASAP